METIEERMMLLDVKLGQIAKKEGVNKQAIAKVRRGLRWDAKEDSRQPQATKKVLYQCALQVLKMSRLQVDYWRLRRAGKIERDSFFESK